MVHFLGLLQLRLFNGLCPDFRIVRGLVFDSIVYYDLLCEIFCGYLYATTGHENQVVIA